MSCTCSLRILPCYQCCTVNKAAVGTLYMISLNAEPIWISLAVKLNKRPWKVYTNFWEGYHYTSNFFFSILQLKVGWSTANPPPPPLAIKDP